MTSFPKCGVPVLPAAITASNDAWVVTHIGAHLAAASVEQVVICLPMEASHASTR